MKDILDQLGLSDVNDGTWLGSESISNDSGMLIESRNPATGELIASVRSTDTASNGSEPGTGASVTPS